MIRIKSLIVSLFLFQFSFSQYPVLEDKEVMSLISTGLSKMYNCESNEADSIFNIIATKLPNNPAVPFLKGMNVYWRHFPILPEMINEDNEFVNYMQKTIDLSIPLLKENENHLEACFFKLVAHGLSMLHYADNGLSGKVIPHANPCYREVVKSLELKNESDEYYFVTGLYNYYVEAYPEAHPVYKPIVMLFKKGSKEEGLKELEYAYNNSVFLKAEALQYLSLIYISFEHDIKKSLMYAEILYNLYPKNLYFMSKYAECLLLAKEYDKGLTIINKMFSYKEDKYNLMWALLYKAIVEERHFKQYDKAEKKYNLVIELTEIYGARANQAAAFSYMGLSRISESEKDSKAFAKKAKKYATYEYALW